VDTTRDPVDIDYDAEHDVLRVFVRTPTEDAVAVPSAYGVTVSVSEGLDCIYGLVFENYVESIQHEHGTPASPEERERLFRNSPEWLAGVLPNVVLSFAALAKDRAAEWLR